MIKSFKWIISGALCWLVFFLPVTANIMNAGNLAGMAGGTVLILYGLFRNKLTPKLRQGFHILLLLGIFLMAVLGFFMLRGAANGPEQPATVVVLGCKVNGTVPSRMLRKRVDAAVTYLNAHPEAACICSGGQGADENISEAEAIYRTLVSSGIDPARLYKEENSTNTRENICYSMAIAGEYSLEPRLALASSDFHLYRAVKQGESEGAECYAISAPTDLWLLPTYFLRECFAILRLWILGI